MSTKAASTVDQKKHLPAKTALIAYATAAILAIPLRLWLLTTALPAVEKDRLSFDATVVVLIALFQLFAIVHFSVWFKHVYARLSLLGWRTRYTPAMALATFFVPFAKLFAAADVIDEIYKASEPTRISPAGVKTKPVPPPRFASAWWYLFLVSGVVSDSAAVLLDKERGLLSPEIAAAIAGALLLSVVSCFLAIRFMETIEARFGRCATRLRLDGRPELGELLRRDPMPRSRPLGNFARIALAAAAILRIADSYLLAQGAFFFTANTAMVAGINIALRLAVLLAAVLFGAWYYRSARNAAQLRLLDKAPGVFAFFLPLVNVIFTWRVLQKLWSAVKKSKETSYAATIFVLTLAVNSTAEGALERMVISGVPVTDQTVRYAVVIGLFYVVPYVALAFFIGDVSERLQPLEVAAEIELASAARSALRDVQRKERVEEKPPEPVTRATWGDVLLPIAASVDQGLEKELEAERETRAAATRAKAEARTQERRAAASQYIPNRAATLLQAVLIASAIGGCLGVIGYVFGGRRVLLPTPMAVNAAVLISLLLIVGAPAWAAFTYWIFRAQHNADAVTGRFVRGAGERDAAAAKRFGFGIRTPAAFRGVWFATFGSVSRQAAKWLSVWNVTLRVIQLSPLLFAAAVASGAVTAIVAFVTGAALIAWTAAGMKIVSDVEARIKSQAARKAEIAPAPAISAVPSAGIEPASP